MRDPSGNTALLIAVQHHATVYFRIAVMLIQNGADTFAIDVRGHSVLDKCVSPMARTMILHHNNRVLSGRCTKDELMQKRALAEEKWKSFSITYRGFWDILCALLRAKKRAAPNSPLPLLAKAQSAHVLLKRERVSTPRKFTPIEDILPSIKSTAASSGTECAY